MLRPGVMAIFHMSVAIVSRKAGRSSTGAAAYRAAERVVDERTGDEHDYRRKRGVEATHIVMPSGSDWVPTRSELWNAVEHKNKRADAQVAREFEVALPSEISADARKELAVEFAQRIADRYGVGADVAIHRPSRNGDERNHHAHILTTTNRVERGGKLGNKVRELDAVAHDRSAKHRDRPNEVENLRAEWADLTNTYLERHGFEQRIDHRSLVDQRAVAVARGERDKVADLDRQPTRHMGPAATAIERGISLRRAVDDEPERWRRAPRATELGDTNRRIELAAQLGKIQRDQRGIERETIDTKMSLAEALRERDARDQPGPALRHTEAGGKSLSGAFDTRAVRGDVSGDSSQARAGGERPERGREGLTERFGFLAKSGSRSIDDRREEVPERDREQRHIGDTEPVPTRLALAERFGRLVKLKVPAPDLQVDVRKARVEDERDRSVRGNADDPPTVSAQDHRETVRQPADVGPVIGEPDAAGSEPQSVSGSRLQQLGERLVELKRERQEREDRDPTEHRGPDVDI